MKPSSRISDAGWNDPPKFSYSESSQYSKSPKRNLLNKRVPFPLNATSSSNLPSIDPTATANFNPSLPPPPIGIVPPGTGLTECHCAPPIPGSEASAGDVQSKNNIAESDAADDENRLNEILRNLNDVMEEKSELSNHNVDEHIRRKLQILEDSWKSKLSEDIKRKLLQLSKALKNRDERIADEIHVSLMVDHPKLCSEFISVFRQLINQMKLTNAPNDAELPSIASGHES